MKKEPYCILCNKEIQIIYSSLYDTRFGIPDGYNIGRCMECGLVQTIPRPCQKKLNELYENYYNFSGFKNTLYPKLRYAFLKSFLYRFWLNIDGDISFHTRKGCGRLLDFGCNEGRGLELYKRNGFTAEGLEVNPIAADVARDKGFIVHTSPIEQFQPKELYNVVVLSNVLEHFVNPGETLGHINRILKNRGELWISCPNVESLFRYLFTDKWINWHIPFHLNHFSLDTIRALLNKTGFTITFHQQKTPALWVASSILTASSTHHNQPTKSLRNPVLVPLLTLFIRFFLFPILEIFNFQKRGECLLVIAKKNG